ncbi:MAG: lamin tail domain-containing protein [Nanoarchaeota archaeon]|nr:lamin tail domain-containing protein [Nanoarchaeota archaeon]
MANANSANRRLTACGNKGYIIFLFIFIICFSENVFADVIINEIMYNPATSQGSDSNLEWVELYNNGSSAVNLNTWKLEENDFDNVTINAYGYVVIARNLNIGDENFEAYYGNNDGVWNATDGNYTAVDGNFGTGLSNSGKIINLTNRIYTDLVNYSEDWGADGNGKTLVLYNGSWYESSTIGGSPGMQNNASTQEKTQNKGLKLTVYIDNTTYVGITYTSLFKIENLDYVSGQTDYVNAIIGYNISDIKRDTVNISLKKSKTANTGTFTPTSAGTYEICGWIISSTIDDQNTLDDFACKTITVIDTSAIPCNITINITTNNILVYEKGQSIKFKNQLNNESLPFKIEYWIEDLFGNIYKNKYNTTNTNQKSWKTDIDEQDRVLFIKAVVYPFCNDTNLSDNSAEKMFIVTNNNSETTSPSSGEDSKIEIKKINKEKVSFGDVIKVDVEIHKGSTAKYSVSAFVYKDNKYPSEKTKISLKNKYTDYKLTIPIQLKPNCNNYYKDGTYEIKIEGLGESYSEEIKIEGTKTSFCKNTQSSSSKNTSKTSKKKKTAYNEYNIFNKLLCNEKPDDYKVVYESNNEKIKKLIPYFIITLTTLISIVFIWRR